MKKTSFAATLSAALALSLCFSTVSLADDSAKAPSTGSTKPMLGKGPADEKSLPSSAAPATTTGMTGHTDQSKTVKAMNKDEKAKVEIGGK